MNSLLVDLELIYIDHNHSATCSCTFQLREALELSRIFFPNWNFSLIFCEKLQGTWEAQRPVLRVNEPKKKVARSEAKIHLSSINVRL
jgi:hypothetical protein